MAGAFCSWFCPIALLRRTKDNGNTFSQQLPVSSKHLCYIRNNMPEPIQEMAVFARVVSAGSFSGARRSGMVSLETVCGRAAGAR